MKKILLILLIFLSINSVLASTCVKGVYPCNSKVPVVIQQTPIHSNPSCTCSYNASAINESFVPYTGALNNVDLGSQTLTTSQQLIANVFQDYSTSVFFGYDGTNWLFQNPINVNGLIKQNNVNVCLSNGTNCQPLGSFDSTKYYNKTDNYAIGQNEPYSVLDVHVNSTIQGGYIQTPFFNSGTKSNYILQSENLMTNPWINTTGKTVVTNTDRDPLNTITAERLNGTVVGGGLIQVSNNRTIGCFTFSTYLKGNVNTINNVSIKINSTNETGITSPINLTTEWKRYAISNCFINGGNITVAVIVNINNISMWGAQLDNEIFARAYYPTTTAVVQNTQNTYMPTSLVTSGAITSSGVVTGVGVAVGGALSGASTGAFSGIITNTIQALFISQDGIVTTSTTATTVNAPVQYSPRIRLTGNVWDFGGMATRSINFHEEVMPLVGDIGRNSSGSLDWVFGYNDVTNFGMDKLMSLNSNGTLDVMGTTFDINILNNSNFIGNSSWTTTGGWRINTVTNVANYSFNLGATGNLTQLSTSFNISVKPNRNYELSYNISGTPVAGCLAYIPTTFATNRIYLPGVSITTANTLYDIHLKTNSNPSNFIIVANCTAGQFFLDNLVLKEINSGDIIANGLFTGGGTNGIKIDGLGNVNITAGNITLSNAKTYTNLVVCYLAGGTLGHCTSVVGIDGSCTCVSN